MLSVETVVFGVNIFCSDWKLIQTEAFCRADNFNEANISSQSQYLSQKVKITKSQYEVTMSYSDKTRKSMTWTGTEPKAVN